MIAMATAKDHKSPSLKKRLDNLEGELKRLHDKILQRRLKKLHPSYPISNESLTLKVSPKQCSLKKQRENTNEEGKEWYACLKSITRSIAQGSDAIRRIASITDITSMNDTLSSLLPLTTDYDSFQNKSPSMCRGLLEKDLLAYHVDAALPLRSNSDHSGLEKASDSKALSMSRSDGGISLLQSSSRRLQKPNFRSLQECKKNLLKENLYLKKQVSITQGIHEEVEDLKKKLKEETKRRLVSEKKATALLKGISQIQTKEASDGLLCNKLKTSNPYCANAPVGVQDQLLPELTVHKMTSEELPAESQRSLIEKKYAEEREKRMELEGIVAQFREELCLKKKECAEVTVGQKLALALAEQFRAKYEKDSMLGMGDDVDDHLIKALQESNKECLKLKEEIAKMQNIQESNTNDAYKERALKAEFEVRSLQKKLEHFSNQNPLDATIVQEVLEKHKRAYSELLLAKKCSEAEYKARCRRLEGEVARLHANYEKNIRTLNDRIKKLMLQLQEKLIFIDGITKNKYLCESVLPNKKVFEMSEQGRQCEAVVGSLNAMMAEKEAELQVIQKERDDALEDLSKIQKAMAELQSELGNKNREIDVLLGQLKEKADAIAIKEKILIDQSETVCTLRKSLNEFKKGNDHDREGLISQLKNLQEENARLQCNVDGMTRTLIETDKFREGQEKNMFLLQQLEKQVYDRQKEWEQQLSTMSNEKDQAIQTAKFATQKLVTAVGEYESQLKAHKQLQHLLKASLQEKDQKLQQAVKELERANVQATLTEQNTELMKHDFHKKFNDVCKVCTDVIDHYPDMSSDYT